MNEKIVAAIKVAQVALEGALAELAASAPAPVPAPPVTAPPAPTPPAGSAARTTSFQSSDDIIPNQERGTLAWYGDDSVNRPDKGGMLDGRNRGLRLALFHARLDAFKGTDIIPNDYLAKMDASLQTLTDSGMKCVMQFSYNQSNSYPADPGGDRIAKHAKAFKSVLAKHAGVIPYARAGFLGKWGEWHRYPEEREISIAEGTKVREALLDMFPVTTQIQFRLPRMLMAWDKDPLPASRLLDGSPQSRSGAHIDSILSSKDDGGTFQSDAQRTWLAAHTLNTAFGGESADNVGSDITTDRASVVAYMERYHAIWLTDTYGKQFWAAGKVNGFADVLYRRLGHRFRFNSITAPDATSGSVRISVEVENTGFARIFSKRPVTAFLVGAQGRSGASSVLLPSVEPGKKLSFDIVVDSVPPGGYDIYLGMPDAHPSLATRPEFNLRPANVGVWDARLGLFKTGRRVEVIG